MAITRNIVATHDREWGNTGLAAPDQSGKDEPEGGSRRIHMSGIVDYVRMSGVEGLAGRIDVIAALGDGEGNDADGRIGEAGYDSSALARLDIVDHGAGHPRPT